jgi:predicted ATPase
MTKTIKLNYPEGSIWRRWDLHLHAPGTKLSDCFGNSDNIWDKYIDYLENSYVQAFGITDYFSADGYFNLIEKYQEKYPNSKKVFFPNIEFRLYESVSKDHANPHIHVIFSNDASCNKEQISKFLSNLETYEENENGVKIKCSDLQTPQQFAAASVSLKGIKEALEKTFGKRTPYIIAFPAKNDGVRSTDASSPRKVQITDQIDRDCHLFFGGSDSRDYFLKEDRYAAGKSSPKPVVSGSDAHSFDDLERLEGNVAGYPPTWIKADLTFRGLKQICFEPDARVYIGSEPEVEQRKATQATKFLANLNINQVQGYDQGNGQWFKDVNIPINPELTVIIGNKGSGKSAIVDIIGLLGESRQYEYFSFLSDAGNNKKFKQRGYAENFSATLTWQSTGGVSKLLSENVDTTKPESVRYLPQNYFEQLTNEIEIEEFRKEIEDVVFSHVEETDRMGKSTFAELQDFKTQQNKQETSALKAKLRELNIEIVQLENQADPVHKKKLEGELKAKNEELKSLEKAMPTVVPKPDEETSEQKELSKKIGELIEKQTTLKNKGQQVVEAISKAKQTQQKLSSVLQSISTISQDIKSHKDELKGICDELSLDVDQLIKFETDVSTVNTIMAQVSAKIAILEKDNQIEFTEQTDLSLLESHPDLRASYKYLSAQIEKLKEQLGTPQRKYQNYLEKLAKWNSQKIAIVGEETDPQPETIKFLEEKISYIENNLAGKLSEKLNARKEIVRQIFESKKHILQFYSDLKESVEAKLSSVRTAEFSVEIDASFVLDRTFFNDFLGHINKKRKGAFHGSNEPEKVLKALMVEIDWNDFDSVFGFFEALIESMRNYKGETIQIKEQVADKKEFYDFLFSLGYFSAKYELRLGGKNLNELSPGEKGLLLLVFYLQLDKDNIPLVIDQPEDNLDNDSIFTVLAKCIRQAKKNRQVILVTHNPNLAVGADAEQVIFVRLEKAENYKFSYDTGAIENPAINEKIVLVLEGSQPAFVKRRLKYEI